MGCFYIESPGMRLLLQRLRTRTFRDLTAVSSIIRPGVSESGMMEAYISRRLGEEPAQYAAPGLEPILQETFGVMVYQEDVIRVAHEFVGLTLSEADLLRRAMSGKYRSHAEMESLTGSFFAKGRERGIGDAVLAELWAQIRSFAGYAFCKAHSASFAQLSYQVAYLKAHHPAEFFAALVNNQGGFYGTAAYMEEARRWGMEILPPDVNASEDEFAGKGSLLRCGFFTLRGLRPGALDAVYEERGEGPYRSFADLCSRLRKRLRPAEIEVLVRAGACDSFGVTRGALLEQLRQVGGKELESWRAGEGGAGEQASRNAEERRGRKANEKENKQGDATNIALDPSRNFSVWTHPPQASFGKFHFSPARQLSSSPARSLLPQLSLSELLSGEVRTLGYAPTAHPLTPMLGWAQERGYMHAGDLPARAGGTARAWGQVVTYKRIPTKKTKEAMAFVTLEDPTGLTELVFFPKAYARFGSLITSGRPLVVEGKVENDRGGLTLTVGHAWAVRGVVVPKPVEERVAAEGVA
jgi:DNA polymerase III alpha subunit